jgi:hypothetical protein
MIDACKLHKSVINQNSNKMEWEENLFRTTTLKYSQIEKEVNHAILDHQIS